MDVDVSGLGWRIFGGTFTSLRDFIWGRRESVRAGQLSEEFRVGNLGAWVSRALGMAGAGCPLPVFRTYFSE